MHRYQTGLHLAYLSQAAAMCPPSCLTPFLLSSLCLWVYVWLCLSFYSQKNIPTHLSSIHESPTVLIRQTFMRYVYFLTTG